MTKEAIQNEALHRAVMSQSIMNYEPIIRGFLDMGIPAEDIRPRENVFTFWAWKALGRRVKKGQHGVKAVTFIPVKGKDDQEEDGKRKAGYRMPRTVTVFHVSQTEPDEPTHARSISNFVTA